MVLCTSSWRIKQTTEDLNKILTVCGKAYVHPMTDIGRINKKGTVGVSGDPCDICWCKSNTLPNRIRTHSTSCNWTLLLAKPTRTPVKPESHQCSYTFCMIATFFILGIFIPILWTSIGPYVLIPLLNYLPVCHMHALISSINHPRLNQDPIEYAQIWSLPGTVLAVHF